MNDAPPGLAGRRKKLVERLFGQLFRWCPADRLQVVARSVQIPMHRQQKLFRKAWFVDTGLA